MVSTEDCTGACDVHLIEQCSSEQDVPPLVVSMWQRCPQVCAVSGAVLLWEPTVVVVQHLGMHALFEGIGFMDRVQ